MSEHEWELDERLPRYDDLREFEVWLRSGAVRRVRRIGNRSAYLTPGLLVFTDCAHPMQNVVCDEDTVTGWRLSGRAAPPMPRSPDTPSLWRDLLGRTSTYDAEAHVAAYPGF